MQRVSRILKAFVNAAISSLIMVLGTEVASASSQRSVCFRAVLEGQVSAGQGFEKVFARRLRFYLEPLRSGWIVRVLDADVARGAHDFAELATPPYQSVSPLLISTDWSFRAQDAVGWNPRHFRFAADRRVFAELEQIQPRALSGNVDAETRLAALVSTQPDATFQLLNARFAPGIADQARMASAVALHLAGTPHDVDTSPSPTPLGKLETLHFRVSFNLPFGVRAAKDAAEQAIPCSVEPTRGALTASQKSQSKNSK